MSGLTQKMFASGENSLGADLGLLVLRVSVGLAMAFGHGLGKLPPSAGFVSKTGELGFPAPEVFAWLAALSEFGGGLLLALGLLTRPAAAAVLFTMGVAFFLAHAGDAFGDRELSYAYGSAAIALLLAGGGRYSLDAIVGRRLRRA
ncbi:DoxX family protein [Rubricoccus marinus]|nr:DoxX family protein [Rubricoccus marinus]